MVRQKVADGSHLRGGPSASRHGDATAVVGESHRPHDALLVGAVLVRQLVGRTVAQRAGVARTPRGVVHQTVRDLLGHNGVCAALVVEAATFSDVEHGERRDKSPTRIVRASNRDALLCCVNGQSRTERTAEDAK